MRKGVVIIAIIVITSVMLTVPFFTKERSKQQISSLSPKEKEVIKEIFLDILVQEYREKYTPKYYVKEEKGVIILTTTSNNTNNNTNRELKEVSLKGHNIFKVISPKGDTILFGHKDKILGKPLFIIRGPATEGVTYYYIYNEKKLYVPEQFKVIKK